MRTAENILYALVIVIMLLSAIQKEAHLVRETELYGDFTPAEKPVFSWQNWVNSDFQSSLDQYLNDNNGFNHFLIRLNNQLDYSLFQYIHADGVVKGKNGQLFEYDYIRSYTGLDYLGEDFIDKKMRRLKFLQEYMKDSLDIDFIFVLEPGKASAYPEHIPDKYLKSRQALTNYRTILTKAKEYGVDCIDLNQWFTQLKPGVPYPVYGQYGTHWSLYGMSFAADSLLSLIAQTRNIQLRDVTIDSFTVEDRARAPDYDMAAAMNLMFRLKDREPLAYPVYSFGEHTEGCDFPKVLVVGDSYYWNIFNTDIPREVFQNEAFWYFGHLVYPEYYFQPTHVEDLDVQAEIEKQDVILLMTTERFLYKFDWKLIDRLYGIYGATSRFDRTYDYAWMITSDDEWFASLVKKSRKEKMPLDSILYMNARYVFWEQEPDNYTVYYGLSELEDKIRQDGEWMEKVARKARENNIPLEAMIRQDAEYVLSTESPDAFNLYRSIQDNIRALLNDSIQVEALKRDAAFYRISFDEMVYIKAEKMLGASQ
jgi:hypothetical protein